MMSLPDFDYKQVIVYRVSGKHETLSFQADNLLIKDEDGKICLQHSCHRTFALFIVGNITLTSVLIKRARQFGFPILLLGRNCKLDAAFNNHAEGNFLLRRKQYLMGARSLDLARRILSMKIANQIGLLAASRYLAEEDHAAIRALRELHCFDADSPDTLRGMEGTASRVFFKAYFRNMQWTRREPRCRHDTNNLLLDIGYTYLFNFMDALLAIYGFDPFCGFFHTFFYQRKSLVCDMVEPFRCIVDHRLRKSFNLKQIDPDDFYLDKQQYCLRHDREGKYTALFLKAILERKDELFKFVQAYYRWFMKDMPIAGFPEFKI